MNRKTISIVLVLIVLIIGAGLYFFSDKVQRVNGITESIFKGILEGDHHYFPQETDISQEELEEINITKIVADIGKGITANRKDKLKTIEEESLKALTITAEDLLKEEQLRHSKAKAKLAKLVDLKDLPDKLKPLKKHLHQPFKMGACQLCHIDAKLKPKELTNKSIKELCYRCHKTRYTQKIAHKPVKEGKCISCHDPHQSNTNNLLKAKSINNLCINCHKNNNKHKVKKTISMKGVYKHKPAKKNCLECHEPHSAKYNNLLKDKGNLNLCLDCHSKLEKHVNMKLWIENVAYKHGALTKSKNKCLECHDPHSTNHKGILKQQQVKMCLKCHDKEVKLDEDNQTIINMKKHLEENSNWHKPIKDIKKEGGCAACHNPHGSNHYSILRKTYSNEFYVDLKTKKEFICFKCHKVAKIEAKYSTKTNFRDGKINLHFLHVNNKKGRACRICHDEHASKYPHLIRSYTEFGGIKFPLRYISTKTGGSCQPACHKKYDYDRVNQKNRYSKDIFKK